jgi:hypothetical protein
MRKHPKGIVYVINPAHKLYPTNEAFFIHYKTNAGYMVKFCGVWHTVPLKDGYEL